VEDGFERRRSFLFEANYYYFEYPGMIRRLPGFLGPVSGVCTEMRGAKEIRVGVWTTCRRRLGMCQHSNTWVCVHRFTERGENLSPIFVFILFIPLPCISPISVIHMSILTSTNGLRSPLTTLSVPYLYYLIRQMNAAQTDNFAYTKKGLRMYAHSCCYCAPVVTCHVFFGGRLALDFPSKFR
jgi:hypothetical protein